MELSQELIDLHDELACRLKEYEHRAGKCPPIDVLNELRYAFRGVIELHSETKSVEEANQHIGHALRCAYHDLVDGILIELSR